MGTSLDDVLSHEFSDFLAYSRSKHAEESLLFWNAVEAFRRRAVVLENEIVKKESLSDAVAESSEVKPTFIDIVKRKQKSFVKMLLEATQDEKLKLRKDFLAQTENYSSAKNLDLTLHENMAFKQKESENELQLFEMARQLFFTFLDESTSSNLICLDSELRRQVEAVLNTGHVQHDIYDEAQREVFGEMKTNLLPGYLEEKKARIFPEHFQKH